MQLTQFRADHRMKYLGQGYVHNYALVISKQTATTLLNSLES
jgi:hypothetical protein